MALCMSIAMEEMIQVIFAEKATTIAAMSSQTCSLLQL